MQLYIYNLQTAALSPFKSSSAQFRSKEDFEGPECSSHCQITERCILLVATLLHQQSAQPNKVKRHNIPSIYRQQLLRSLRAQQYSSDQKKVLKDQSAQTTARVASIAYCLQLPLVMFSVSFPFYHYYYYYYYYFLSTCLCQFISLFYCIILIFYCISFLSVLFLFCAFSLYSLLLLYIAAIFSHSFSFPSNKLYVLFSVWHTIMCSLVSSSVLQMGHVMSDSFLLQLHFMFHICNLMFMTSFVVLLSHLLIYYSLSHLSFRNV